ncbi:MAG: phosphate ABC transporter substrate-binding protein PstS [Syntrophorhabdaceae bacterium]|nr:phosphate ABC transporter substrate-binding protein PstS [Syntrophorhabdaceae bacterium]
MIGRYIKSIIYSFVLFLIFYPCLCFAKDIELTGKGATFPLPFYLKAFGHYQKHYKTKINYVGVGSGEGLKALSSKTIDFAGTDFIRVDGFPENINELIYIPTCIGAVVVIYNLTDNPNVKFTPEIISDIFLGKITRWDDPKLRCINKDIKLPELPITVVRRLDRSGTTYVFSEFLSRHSEMWRKNVGIKNILTGLPGLEAKGNPGVAGLVKQKSGSIGYVELVYALANRLPTGHIMNRSGRFIEPSVVSIKKAVEGYTQEKELTTLIEAINPDGYPISCFTFIAVLREQSYYGRDLQRAVELVKMLKWLIGDGQQYGEALHYVSLPSNIQETARKSLEQITYKGNPLLLHIK